VRELFAPAAAAAARIRAEAPAGPAAPTPASQLCPCPSMLPGWSLPSCPSESPADWGPAHAPAPAAPADCFPLPACSAGPAASLGPSESAWDCHAGAHAGGGAGARWEDGPSPLDGVYDGGCMEGWLGESEEWDRVGLGGWPVWPEAARLPAC
jgi:hypothetical protein